MSPCILQLKNLSSNGYGKTFDKEYYALHKKIRYNASHRLAYEQAYGPIPPGMVVRHMCHNPNCINPQHLTIGTHADNMRDMVLANRQAKGEGNGTSKLTEKEVLEIRSLKPVCRSPYGFVKSLCLKYNIHKSQIYDIWHNKIWKHI